MRFVPAAELKPGMITTKPIYQRGILILAANHTLKQDTINAIRRSDLQGLYIYDEFSNFEQLNQILDDNLRYRTTFTTASTADGGLAMTGTTKTETGESDPVAKDGKWHHIAATFQRVGNKTRETFFCDYKEICHSDGGNPLRTNLINSELRIGGGITGWIDEIRISKGVLPTDAFLRRKTLGLVIIIK